MRRWLPIALILTMAVILYGGSQNTFKEPRAVPLAKHGMPASELYVTNPSDQLPTVGSRNPHTGDEVIISEGFESIADGALPTGWTQVDVDNGTCAQFTNAFSRWRAYTYSAHGGSKIAFNHYNDAALANNDWLILPQQNLTGAITLSYWIASQDAGYLESYEVRVSTTGTLPANFTNLIYTGTNIPTTFTQHTHDLSAYAGAPFYIAFHHNSVDMFVIRLDDILLEAGAVTPRGAISGTVTDASNGSPLQNVAVAVTGTSLTTTTNASGVYYVTNVPVNTYTVSFTKSGYMQTDVTGVIVIANDTVTADAAMPHSNNVIEEGFEDITDGSLPTGWTQVDVDNGTCAQFSSAFSRWRVYTYSAHGGSKICFNHYNDAALPNNDWLILPQQNLSAPINLSYWIASQDAGYLESYEVRVSTTGTLPANFTNLIYSGTNIPTTFTQHTHDLSTYAGAPFYIAFHHNSADMFIIRLDDVLLSGSVQPTGSVSGTVTSSATSAPISGVTVSVIGTTLTATTNASGAYIFSSVLADTQDIRFEKTGFETFIAEGVIVTAGETVDLDVSLDSTDAAENITLSPKEFAFYGNYPNPFNARTEFRFAVDRTGLVELALYNIVGQEVARVVQETMTAGVHTVAFDAGDLPSGLYLARLSAAGHTAVQKTMLLK
jgi:hypothetical protein